MGFVVFVQLLSCIGLFATPWTVVHQTPLFMEFPRQEFWSELPFPSPGDLPDSGIKPMSPALVGGFFTTEPPRQPLYPEQISVKNREISFEVLVRQATRQACGKCVSRQIDLKGRDKVSPEQWFSDIFSLRISSHL